jgi:uncharacterized protein YutE (UPF0331/DUF86 family)
MADIRERIQAEFENIERALSELPDADSLPSLSSLELAGVATLIHSFYNGVENVLKQLLISKDLAIPQSSSWHKDLLQTCVCEGLISESTAKHLGRYLGFRHFFSHAYSFDLDKTRMIPLVKQIRAAYNSLVKDVQETLEHL